MICSENRYTLFPIMRNPPGTSAAGGFFTEDLPASSPALRVQKSIRKRHIEH
jgi:hypothetical protein